MKLMVNIPVTREACGVFIRGLVKQGYEVVCDWGTLDENLNPVYDEKGEGGYYFKLNGETTIDYSISCFEDSEGDGVEVCYLGVRPK